MKGLLLKDVNFLKGQKQFFGALVIIMVMFIFINSSYAFVISYVTIMFSVLVITTMSYDEYENGMCYLLSLPVSRKLYVKEKYVFSVLSVLCGLFSVVAVIVIAVAVKESTFVTEEIISAAAASSLIAISAVSVTLPIQLKFGAEKSRMALMGVFGVGFLGVFVVMKLCEAAEIDVMPLLESIFRDNLAVTIGGGVIFEAVVLAVSYLISVGIMTKREY